MALQNKLYSDIPPDFYDRALTESNPFTKFYHQERYAKIRSFLLARYKKSMKIVDLGSGSSNWNTELLNVTGVDINESMLEYAKSKGRIRDFVVCDIANDQIALEKESFDFVVISEVLEHLDAPAQLILKAKDLLRKGEFLIVTVPLDTPISEWRFLFEISCFLRGDILGNEYYKKRCGHVQHFSLESIVKLLAANGFRVAEKNVTFLNIGLIAEKV